MPGSGATAAARTAGELWTRSELQRLRAAAFEPPAISDFLRASWRRAADVRRERPALAAQARRWVAAGAVAWLLPAAARIQPFRRAAVPGLAWWAATGVMLDWHLGMVETPDGRPRPLGPADALTLTRAWLVPIAFAAPHPVVIAAGAATDALDGLVARRREPTRAGRDLEGLVDACFAAAALAGLRHAERIGRAPAAAELARLGCGLTYAVVVYFARATAPAPVLLGAARASTVLRLGGLVVAASGRRRAGDGLTLAGSAASFGLLARAVAAR
jgi:phosphatidylglycerophosphate synthase